jgi:hypothetical protein
MWKIEGLEFSLGTPHLVHCCLWRLGTETTTSTKVAFKKQGKVKLMTWDIGRWQAVNDFRSIIGLGNVAWWTSWTASTGMQNACIGCVPPFIKKTFIATPAALQWNFTSHFQFCTVPHPVLKSVITCSNPCCLPFLAARCPSSSRGCSALLAIPRHLPPAAGGVAFSQFPT